MLINDWANSTLAQAAIDQGGLMSFLPIILMFVVLYFLMIRPQMKRQKEHKAMVSALAKGDEVMTAGGVLGKITHVSDNYVTLDIGHESDTPVEILIQRSSVGQVLPKGTIKSL